MREEHTEAPPVLPSGPDAQELRFSPLQWGLRVRWVFVAVLAVAGTVYGLWVRAPAGAFLFWALFLAVLSGLNLLNGYLLRRGGLADAANGGDANPRWVFVLGAVDLLLITVAVYATGGPQSPAGWLYAAPIMALSLFGGWRFGVPVAAASWILYTGLLLAVAAGWLPPIYPERIAVGFPPNPGETPAIATPLLAHTAIMVLSAGLCSWFYEERKRFEDQLQYWAVRDPLTNLLNRRSLQRALQRAIARADQGHPCVLLFVDVDNLKMVNDSFGHGAGDQVLLSVVDRLRRVLRSGDVIARLAGDEFVVLLDGATIAQATSIAQRLRQAVGEVPVIIGGQPVYMTVSIGLVPIDGCQTAETLLSWADAAMYEAKLQGRNQVVVPAVTEEEKARMNEHWAWVHRFKHALDEDRLLFHYQPIVHLADGRVAAYEALLRLRDEDGRLIFPREFLPMAEQTGRMKEIDRWVIEQGLRVLEANPGLKLTVNVSAQTLNDDELVGRFLQRMRDYASRHPRLGVEITETMVIRDLEAAQESIERLRTAGNRIFLDDFGAGFSSFTYLRFLTVDVIKIDGSLIRDLKENPRHQAMVRAIKVLADGFQLETVAEFVEDEETALLLRQMGITYGQGYYFAEPAPFFVEPVVTGFGRGQAG